MGYLVVKRCLDIMVSFFLLIVLSPFYFITINQLNLLFKQERIGKNGIIFTIYKVRTMVKQIERDGVKLSDAERMTAVGRWVRKLSLDELPQLWNVLKGDMSFIGPRPLLPKYLPLYNEEQKKRHNVKPGITGWAQVNGRNLISWSEKFNFDLYYVNHISFLLDMKILIMTINKVIKREGINSGENITMGEFNGRN